MGLLYLYLYLYKDRHKLKKIDFEMVGAWGGWLVHQLTKSCT